MLGAAPGLLALAVGLPDHVAARSLIGRGGWGAARSQRRPGRRPAAQHPGARPVPSRRTRVRGGHAPSVFPSHASGRRRPPGDDVAAPASRASRTRPSSGWRCTRNVLRSASPGCRTAFRRCGSPGRPGSRRSALAVAADRSRISGPVQDHRTGRLQTNPEADGAPRNRRTMPAQTGMPHLPSRRGNPASGPGHPGHAIGVRSARTASNRPGQALDSRPPAGTGSLVQPDHLTQQGVGTR